MITKRVLLSWSSGKDSAWALHELRRNPGLQVTGLLTTMNERADRVAMHGVRSDLLRAQACATGLPLRCVRLPWPCSNEIYESRMHAALEWARREGVTHLAFGDLFLPDIRQYRERMLEGSGIEPLFPIWSSPEETPALARAMMASGLRAILSCVDTRTLTKSFAGREYDARLLSDLPIGTDPCGELGEFHTYCYAGPMFSREIHVNPGGAVIDGDFCFRELVPVAGPKLS